MEHSSPVVPPLISSIRVGNFFRDYRLEGNEGIGGIQPSAFKFVVDGGAAAIAVSSEIPLDDFDKKLRSIIMGKSASTRNLIVESFAVKPRVDQSNESHSVSAYWRKVYESSGRNGGVPSTFSVRHRAFDPAYSGILVRYRQPLAYPIPVWKQGSGYPLGFYKLSRSQLVVPQSVVFFASFMNRLQQLALHLEYLEDRRRQAIHTDTGRIPEPSTEQKNVKVDIVFTLGFGSLYMAAAISEGGSEMLGFDASKWIKVFDRCTSRGSKIFGYGGGMFRSKKFLEQNAELLDQLIDEAVSWWVPERKSNKEVDQRVVRGEREVVRVALETLREQLMNMYDDVDGLLRQRDELLAQRSKGRHSEKREPFSPTARNL